MSDVSSRYGTRHQPQWLWPVVAVIGISLGVAWAAWGAFQEKPISVQVYGYDVVSPSLVTITLDIHRPDPREAECTVYSQAADHAVVGEKTVTVPASEHESVRLDIDVETERKGVNGVLRECHVTD